MKATPKERSKTRMLQRGGRERGGVYIDNTQNSKEYLIDFAVRMLKLELDNMENSASIDELHKISKIIVELEYISKKWDGVRIFA